MATAQMYLSITKIFREALLNVKAPGVARVMMRSAATESANPLFTPLLASRGE